MISAALIVALLASGVYWATPTALLAGLVAVFVYYER